MKQNNQFPKHTSKLQLEALLRSLLCGIAVGFGANFVAALVTWFSPLNGMWIPLTALAAFTIISTPIFYFARFRPTVMSSARRIDSLGLEERIVTMVEYQNDNSLIAEMQRRDARAALAKTNAKQLKISVSTAIIVATIVCVCLGAGMTTVNALSESGILSGGDDIVNSIVEEQRAEYVTVSYVIKQGGMFEGDEDQIIIKGTDATTITAIADDEFVFKGWSDGSIDPTRTDYAVFEDVVYEAIFMPLGEGQEGEESEDEQGDENEDEQAPPKEDSENSQQKPSDEQPPKNENENNPGAGGKYEPNNQIVDGNKFYREELDASYREAALSLLEDENSGLSDEERELIKKYFGIV